MISVFLVNIYIDRSMDDVSYVSTFLVSVLMESTEGTLAFL